MSTRQRVALVTLGCARNEVDSEELAARLELGGWELAEDPADADVAVVNTCGFIDAAKKDSIDTLLAAADLKGSGRTRAVVAVGCLAQRYGVHLAEALPEADAVLGFDAYADLATTLRDVLDGASVTSHVPADRRTMLPLSPVQRPAAASALQLPGHGLPVPMGAGGVLRTRLDDRVWAPLKIASGCDRRCTFCAIPSFRGSFVSRPAEQILGEAQWLAQSGVRELVLVSENSTSYGKDLGDLTALEALLRDIAVVDGPVWTRVCYLQPAEIRPGLLDVLLGTSGVAAYADLSFQHSSPTVLRRMRRFGGTTDFLRLVEDIRRRRPAAGIRTNVIVGFPGETDTDLGELADFLVAARLDAVGVFGYSDEEGTEAVDLEGHLPEDEVAARVEEITRLVEELTEQRAGERVGEQVTVLVEEVSDGVVVGRAEHQGPDVDGGTTVSGAPDGVRPGDLLTAVVTDTEGIDLLARHR